MNYQELNSILSFITDVPEASITKDTSLDDLNIGEEGYAKIAEEIQLEREDTDVEYIKCLQSVGDLLSYVNGE